MNNNLIILRDCDPNPSEDDLSVEMKEYLVGRDSSEVGKAVEILKDANLNPHAGLLNNMRMEIDSFFGNAPKEPIGEVLDKKIPGKGGDISIRIYKLKNKGKHPIVMYFHGGGWIQCSINSHDNIMPCHNKPHSMYNCIC